MLIHTPAYCFFLNVLSYYFLLHLHKCNVGFNTSFTKFVNHVYSNSLRQLVIKSEYVGVSSGEKKNIMFILFRLSYDDWPNVYKSVL